MPAFSELSERRLATCHPDLQRVLREVIKVTDFMVLCGHRGQEEQDAAYHDGRSQVQWPNSKHNALPSVAVDIAPWPVDWHNREAFFLFAGFVLGIGRQMGVRLIWGGRWKGLQDLPHFELCGDDAG